MSGFSIMASRQSLRLQDMGPELSLFKDLCFICLLELDIQSVVRCRVMPCCGKFLHKRCFKKANEQSFQCGHCRRPSLDDSNDTISVDDDLRANEHLADSPDNPPIWVLPPDLAGPAPLERARNAISDHRASAMAHTLHQEGMSSWDALPFPIDPLVWYIFWVQLDWFISTSPDGRNPVYIHASVNTPIEPTQEVRKTFYRLVSKIIPGAVYPCLQEIVHREHFTHIADYERNGRRYPFNRNEVTVTNIRMTRFWSPEYHDDAPYTSRLTWTQVGL